MQNGQRRNYWLLAAIASFLIWGGLSPVVIKMIALPGPYISLIGVIFGWLSILPKIIAKYKRRDFAAISSKSWKYVIGASIVGSLVFVFSHLAYQLTTIATAVLCFATMPFITNFVFMPLYGEKKPGTSETISLLIGFVGLALSFSSGLEFSYGIVCALMAAVVFAWYNALVKKIDDKEVPSDLFIFLTLLLGTPIALISAVSLWSLGLIPVLELAAISLKMMMFLFIFGYINFSLANSLYLYSVRNSPSISRVAMMSYTEPFWGVLFGFLLFSEKITASFIIGMIVVLYSGFKITNQQPKKRLHDD